MTRATAATLALIALLGLTGLTWLARADLAPGLVAGLALVKIAVIGAVFLELDRSWPGWALCFVIGTAGVLLGAAALIA